MSLRLPKGLSQMFDRSPTGLMLASLDAAVKRSNWVRDLPPVLAKCQPRKRPPGWVRAGDLAEPCDRMLAAAFLKQPPSPVWEPRTLRLFENGTFAHLRYYMWWAMYPEPWDNVAPLQLRKWPVAGEMDGLLMHPEIGEWPVELKTINLTQFNSLNAPEPEHRQQLNTYMGINGNREGVVWYENKNNQQPKLFEVAHDAVEWGRYWKRVTGIAADIASRRLPGACDNCRDESFCRGLKVSPQVATVCQKAGAE